MQGPDPASGWSKRQCPWSLTVSLEQVVWSTFLSFLGFHQCSLNFLMNSIQFNSNFICIAFVTIKMVSRRFIETFHEVWLVRQRVAYLKQNLSALHFHLPYGRYYILAYVTEKSRTFKFSSDKTRQAYGVCLLKVFLSGQLHSKKWNFSFLIHVYFGVNFVL